MAPTALWAQSATFALDHNVLNLSGGATVTAAFTADYDTTGKLSVYNTAGELIMTLFPTTAGNQVSAHQTYSLVWDGKNAAGNKVAAGIYVFHLSLNLGSYEKRLIVLR
jgi:flagellar hook assembly protein FlgD